MSLSACGSRHKCADGGEGECDQAQGHCGKHLCRVCMKFFSGGEALHTDAAADGPGNGDGYEKGTGSSGGYGADSPGLGGGYGKGTGPGSAQAGDSPGLGGGYGKGPGSGRGYVTDSPGLGGGYDKGIGPGGGQAADSPGLGGGYGKGPDSGSGYVTDSPGLGGGYGKGPGSDGFVTHSPGLGGGYIVGQHAASAAARSDLTREQIASEAGLSTGRVWTISPMGRGSAPSMCCITATAGEGSGIAIPDAQASNSFWESARAAERLLSAHARELPGNCDPKACEVSIQHHGPSEDFSGTGLGLALLVALGSASSGRRVRPGLVVVGSMDQEGRLESVSNLSAIADLGAAHGIGTLLLPVSCRNQLSELSEDLAIKIRFEFYADWRDAFLKSLSD
jgi:hypothetical protein